MDDHRPDPAEERRPEDTAAAAGNTNAGSSGDTKPTGNVNAGRKADSSDEDAPLGGDQTTQDQLDADNDVEADMLKTLNPDDSPA